MILYRFKRFSSDFRTVIYIACYFNSCGSLKAQQCELRPL
jgi:hypothetical protein